MVLIGTFGKVKHQRIGHRHPQDAQALMLIGKVGRA